MKLQGKRAVVTGAASQGIGRAIADAFVEEGAAIIVIDKQTPAESRADQLPYVQTDISDATKLIEALEQARDTLGSIDILVNAAGVTHRKRFLDLTLADWDEVHAVNVRPHFVATQWVARDLKDKERPGSIINLASINGRIATLGQAHYGATKGAVLSFTRAAAIELAPYRIRVNTISPGCIETDLNRDLLATDDFRDLRKAAIPLNKVGEPGEIAPVAVLLASDDGGFITGADYTIDGGQTIW